MTHSRCAARRVTPDRQYCSTSPLNNGCFTESQVLEIEPLVRPERLYGWEQIVLVARTLVPIAGDVVTGTGKPFLIESQAGGVRD